MSKTISILAGFTAIAATMGMSLSANATLIGDTVTFTRNFNGNNFFVPLAAVVGAGIEFTEPSFPSAISDVGENSIRIDFPISLGFTPPQFYVWDSLDWIDAAASVITGVNVTLGGRIDPIPDTDTPAFGPDNVIFTDHSVRLDVGNYLFFPNAFVEIALETGRRAVESVPEPGTLAVFALGLAGIGFARRTASKRRHGATCAA